jgi:hypothetical protein
MKWTDTIQRWRDLKPEERLQIRWRRISRQVALSMSFEGQPVDLYWLETLHRRTEPPATSKPRGTDHLQLSKPMPNIRSFKELKVWQRSVEAAVAVFELSKRFPDAEKYSFTDQIRRASQSVPSNTSEAWRKRRYAAAFISKLNDSEG